MESVGDVLKGQPSRFQYQDLVQQIVKDPDVATFIQKKSLSQEELNRSISKETNAREMSIIALAQGRAKVKNISFETALGLIDFYDKNHEKFED